MKTILGTLLFSMLIVAAPFAAANEMQLTFDDARSAVIIEHDLCIPTPVFNNIDHRSRFAKSELKRNVILNKESFINGVQETFNLNPEQAKSQFYYALFMVNDIDTVPLNVKKTGNETCFTKLVPVLIDKQRDLQKILPLTNKGLFHIVTLADQYVSDVAAILNTNNIPFNEITILNATTLVAKYQTNGGPAVYQTFNMEQYQSLYRAEVATVFIAAHDDYKGAIASYLSKYGFNIVQDRSQAYWIMLTKVQPANNNYLDIEITLESNNSTISIRNNPQDLRIEDLQESGLTNKAIAYHLASMKLDQHLSFKPTNETKHR